MGVVSTDIISKCVLLKAFSLNNKLPEFHKLLSDNLLMLFITESWYSGSVINGMLDCSHSYSIYHKAFPHKQCGGEVIGMVATNIQSHSIPLPSKFYYIEIVAFCVITTGGNFRFIVVYRPPEFNKLGRDYTCLLIKIMCLLIKLIHEVTAMLESNPYVFVYAIDFSKAFDTV